MAKNSFMAAIILLLCTFLIKYAIYINNIENIRYLSASTQASHLSTPCIVGKDCPQESTAGIAPSNSFVNLTFIKASSGDSSPTWVADDPHRKYIQINKTGNYKISYNINGVLCGGSVGDSVQFRAEVVFKPIPQEILDNKHYNPISSATIIATNDGAITGSDNLGIGGAANAGGEVILNLAKGTRLGLTYLINGYQVSNKPITFVPDSFSADCAYGGFASYLSVEGLD